MNNLMFDFENLKISAFTKYSQFNSDINNTTIGPNRTPPKRIQNVSTTTPKKSPKPITTCKENSSPVNQILKDFENERREKVEKAINNRHAKFEEFSRSQILSNQSDWLNQQRGFIQDVQNQEQTILQTINESSPNRTTNEQIRQNYQDMIQRKILGEQQLKKNKERQRVLNDHIDQIHKSQLEFRTIYQEIMALIKLCTSNEDLKQALGDDFKLLKVLPDTMEELVVKCKNFTVEEVAITNAASIVAEVVRLKNRVEDCVVRINTPPANVQPPQPNSTEVALTQYVSVANLKKFADLKKFLSEFGERFTGLLADESMKQFRFDCKKAINIPVNAISAVSSDHLQDKYRRLSDLLGGKRVSVGDKQISAAAHPQGVNFCMDLLARKFVLQGDLMVSSNPDAAFCYASIIVSLWNDHPDFGALLLGYFYTQCPVCVPFYVPRTDEQSTEDYYVSLGYQYTNGQIEKQDKFLKRMTGILRLYFAIFVAKPKRGQTRSPHCIANAWAFLSSLLKLEPHLDITATALHIFLETIGFEMEAKYGRAFKKIVRIIVDKFVPALKQIDSGGPVTRLEVLLQEYRENGRFTKPKGVLPDHFW